MNSQSGNPADYQAEMRRAAGLTFGLAVGAAAVMALAAYLSRPDAKKIEIGPTIGAVEDWLKKTTKTMRKGARELIEQIDSVGK